eukprot:6501984-Prymnesium_polylepis.1
MSTPTARGRVQRRPWRCRTSQPRALAAHLPDDGRPDDEVSTGDEEVEGRREGHGRMGRRCGKCTLALICAAQAHAGSRHLGTPPAESLHVSWLVPTIKWKDGSIACVLCRVLVSRRRSSREPTARALLQQPCQPRCPRRR